MAKFTSSPAGFASAFTADEANPSHALGELAITPDGRRFRYVRAGASALGIGELIQSPAEVTNHQNLTPTAATIVGDTSIGVTLGATAATANQYAGGYVTITTGAGVGYRYEIKSHPAASASATLTLTLEESIRVATNTGTSRVDLVRNPFDSVIQNPTTPTGTTVGVAITAITATQYGWIQVGGSSTVLAQGALTVGNLVVASNGTAGAVENAANASTEAQIPVGFAITGVATTEYGSVFLCLS